MLSWLPTVTWSSPTLRTESQEHSNTQVDEESSHASNAEVDLNKLFKDLTFASGEELALSAGQPLSKVCAYSQAPER